MPSLTADLVLTNGDRVEIFNPSDSFFYQNSASPAINPRRPNAFDSTLPYVHASIVFLHGNVNSDLDPDLTHKLSPILPGHLTPREASEQPFPALPRGEDSVSDSLGQSPNQIDAQNAIPTGKVADAVGAFRALAAPHSPPRNPGSMLEGGGKKTPTKWSTPNSVSRNSLPFSSRDGASGMAILTASSERCQASDSGSRSDVAMAGDQSPHPFSTANFNDDLGKHSIQTTCSAPIEMPQTCFQLYNPPEETSKIIATEQVQKPSNLSQSTSLQALSDPLTPPPSPPARAILGGPPSSPLKGGGPDQNTTVIKPNSDPQNGGTSDRERLDEDGRKNTTQTPPKPRYALFCRSSPPKKVQLPIKQLGSPRREVGSDHVPRQMILTEDLPSNEAEPLDAKLFNSSSYRNNSTLNSSKQNQNLWDLFGTPDETKIYSALSCGLACGAIATISVPASPIVAGVAGITAGAIVGYAIAEPISKNMDKKSTTNPAR